MDAKSNDSSNNPSALQSESKSEPVHLNVLSADKSGDSKTNEIIGIMEEIKEAIMTDAIESKSERQDGSNSRQNQLQSTNDSETGCSDSAIHCVDDKTSKCIHISTERKSATNLENCEETKNRKISETKIEEFDSASLSSDSVIDLKREVSSDSDEDQGIFHQDKFEALSLLRKKSKSPFQREISTPPLFHEIKSEPIRYTVDEDFRDHFCNGGILDKCSLDSILELWASDNWEGLFNPPDWLTPIMFARALTSQSSNKLKREQIIEATANLEIARLTSSKDVPQNLKQEALNHIICSSPVNEEDSSELFLDQAKRISLVMYRIYKDIKKILDEQLQEWQNIRQELILNITSATDSMNENIKMQETFSKLTTETVDLLEIIHIKLSEINNADLK